MREDTKTTGHVGRPREFDEDDVLSKIMSLFWKQGYEGTGLSDIIRHTGLQKGSLYKAFGSKHGMYVRALAHYERLVVDATVRALKADGAPQDRIHSFVSAPIVAAWDHQDRRGCFLCNASADHAALDSDTREQVARGFGKLLRALQIPVSEARPDLSQNQAGELSAMLLSVYSGLRIMARASIDRSVLEGARDMAMAQIMHPA